MTFEANIGVGNPAVQALRIRNSRGGTLDWTAETLTTTGGNWLSVSQSSAAASGSSPATIQVSVAAGALAAGTYSGAIRLQSTTTNETLTVPVTFLVAEAAKMLLSQRGLSFTGVAGSGVPPSQEFGILNVGSGAMSWTAEASTFSGGNWLSVSPSSGSSTAGTLQPPLADVRVNAGGLAAGLYSGQVRVTSAGANNSPQFITVTLNMLPAGSNPPPVVRPTGLIFIRPAGSSSPGSQTVRLATPLLAGVQAAANPSTLTGGNWLEVLPRNLVFSASDSRTLTVQPTLGALAPGEYFGALTLLFSDLTSQVVKVLFVVTPGSGSQTSLASKAVMDSTVDPGGAALDGCTPQKLYLAGQSLGSNFSIAVGYPTLVQAQVKDDCGDLVSDSTVVASFDNGDPPLLLVGIGGGLYQASWQPSRAGQNPGGSVGITLRAARAPLAAAETRSNGQITASSASGPSLFSGGIVNAASSAAGEPLAPGSIVSVYGTNLATAAVGASVLPLPTSLANATLSVAGQDVPLFYSSGGQINAQLPFDLPANSRPQVYVRVRSAETGPEVPSVPETITIAAARPAIFTINQQGTGQGAILIANTATLAAPEGSVPGREARPAHREEFISVFCTGLGVTDPAVRSGEMTPADGSLAHVVIPVEATVDGVPAQVSFAGLAPGFVGLYQVNLKTPPRCKPERMSNWSSPRTASPPTPSPSPSSEAGDHRG